MKKCCELFVLFIFLLVPQNLLAENNSVDPHTWHITYVSDTAYPWKCQLADAYENSFYFVDSDLNPVSEFEITAKTPFKFGFVIGNYSNIDFNLSYTLICVQENGQERLSPKTVFVIGANGPADPNIHIVNLYGSTGNYTIIPGVGENYYVGLANQTQSP